jgi:hypothetical protein
MDDNLDRILSTDQDVVPSSAFVDNLMAAVRREASTPAPIAFPWWRVVPGFAICAVALTAFMVIAAIQIYEGAAVAGPAPRLFVNVVETANRVGLGWIALALIASLIPTRLVLAKNLTSSS